MVSEKRQSQRAIALSVPVAVSTAGCLMMPACRPWALAEPHEDIPGNFRAGLATDEEVPAELAAVLNFERHRRDVMRGLERADRESGALHHILIYKDGQSSS